jgi:hypothetical protein
MARINDFQALGFLARGMSALGGRLEPTETAQAARLVIEAMGQTNGFQARGFFAEALSVLVSRLEPAEAGRQTAQTARLLVEAMAKTNDPYALASLARGLSALASRLELAEAARAARLVVEAMGQTTDPYALEYLPGALSALAGRLEPAEAISRIILGARTIGEELSPPTRLSGLATLLQASQLPPCRFSPQELVELLKMPTCVGRTREVILQQLGRTYDRHFADLWAFVDYAHEHHSELDLTTPPQRPQQ